MRQLWLFFQQYYYIFLFAVLEVIAFGFLVTRNNYQQAKFLKSTSFVQTSIDGKRSAYKSFIGLRQTNNLLVQENEELYNRLEELKALLPAKIDTLLIDSTASADYSLQVAKVISNPMNTSNSYITINKGLKDDVKEQAGLIIQNSVVGKVVFAEENYSLAMPIFHTKSRLNIKHLPSKYTGNLVWNGRSFKTVQVEKIPRNASVNVGDTIVTNQYSKSFPEGTLVGTVEKLNFDASKNFYELDVVPFVNFSKLDMVYVVQHKHLHEITTIEEQQ